MEEHYTGVDTFHAGNCLGKVWHILRFDEAGEPSFVEYEFELVVGSGSTRYHIMPEEIPDLLEAYRKACEHVKQLRKDRLASPTAP